MIKVYNLKSVILNCSKRREDTVMVEVKGLVKKYAGNTAVKGISFSVKEGEILGLLGPNGAGKSTTMNIMTGYISSTKGTVTIDGHEILKEPLKARSKIGYLPEQPPLYLDMTVKGYLDFVYRLKKVKKDKKEHIEEICKIVGITDVYNRTIKKLSKGYKQRVGIAQALIGDPPLIILDEPSVGLDPKQIIGMRKLIKLLAKDHTVIISSHILTEIQAICSRVIVIDKGTIVADGAPDEIYNSVSDSAQIILEIEGDRVLATKTLSELEGIKNVKTCESKGQEIYEYTIDIEGQTNSVDIRRRIFKAACENNLVLLGMRNNTKNLESVFLELTDDSGKDTNNKLSDVNKNTEELNNLELSEKDGNEGVLEDKGENSEDRNSGNDKEDTVDGGDNV